MVAFPPLLTACPSLTYVGRVSCVTGYGAAARHQIHILRQHGLRLRIVDAGSVGDPDPGGESVLVQGTRKSDPVEGEGGTIIHLSPNCAEGHRSHPRPHVLVSVWETTRLPREWVPLCNTYDQVWCPTEWQREAYLRSGVDEHRLRVVPFALDPQEHPLGEGEMLPSLERLRREGKTVFGAMFQWSERKAPRTLIGAFLSAFDGDPNVALVLKTYRGDDPNTAVADEIQKICASYRPRSKAPLVTSISRRFTHKETLAFYRGLNGYVSAHRGEGWGLPIHEALLCGTPVIATDWSAPAEFAKGCFQPVEYQLEAPHSMDWQPFYTTDQRWAAPSEESLSKQLLALQPVRDRSRLLALPWAAGSAARHAFGSLL